MKFLFAFIENRLADLRDSRLSEPPVEYTTLAPVWVMPMIRKAEPPRDGFRVEIPVSGL